MNFAHLHWYLDGTDLQRPHTPHDARLDRHPSGHCQFWVHLGLLAQVSVEEVPYHLSHTGHSGGSAHHHYLVYLRKTGQLNWVGGQFVPNSKKATIRPKFQKATIRPKRQFVPIIKSCNLSPI